MPLVNQTDYVGFKGALYTWFRDKSGLGAGKVLWLNQPTPARAKPYGTLQMLSRGKIIGQDYLKEKQSGNVIERTYIGLREMIVQVQTFSIPADDDSDFEALETLEQALAALSMQQVMDAFRIANLGVMDYDILSTADEQAGERWERRAVADLRLTYRTILFDDGTDASPDDGTFIENIESITEDAGNATWNQ